MRSHVSQSAAGRCAFGALLLAFALRALIPQGYMPSSERPFSLQICPDGFPAQLLALHAHHGAASHDAHGTRGGSPAADPHIPAHERVYSADQHCLFGAAAGSGPAPHVSRVAADLAGPAAVLASGAPAIPRQLRRRVQQPRAPPPLS